MPDRLSLAAALIAALLLGAPTAEAAGLCDLDGARVLAGTDGIGGTGLSGGDDGIGGTGVSGPDGIGGTGLSGPDGIGGTGLSSADGIGGTGLSGEDGIGGTGLSGEDGIGGTGIYGTLTRFGSLCVNGVHILLGDETRYQRNGETSHLGEIAVGQVLWVQAQGTPEGLQARSVEAFSAVVGAVTSVDAEAGTIVVGGQTILLGDGGRAGEPASSRNIADALPGVGDFVDVSGLPNENDEIVVSRIDRLSEPIAPYRAPGLRELIDAAPALGALSVEGFLGPEIGPNRFLLAGIQVEAPELATLAENTRIWLAGGRVARDTLAVSRAEFEPRSAADSRGPVAPGRLPEPIELPNVPGGDSKKPASDEPGAQIQPAPVRNATDVLISDGASTGVETLPGIEVEIQPTVVDDAIIDSLIGLDSAIKTEILAEDAFDSRSGVLGAEPSIIVPDARSHTLDAIKVPELIDSIQEKPRLDSERVKGD